MGTKRETRLGKGEVIQSAPMFLLHFEKTKKNRDSLMILEVRR